MECKEAVYDIYMACTEEGKTSIKYQPWMRDRAMRDIPAFDCPCHQAPESYVSHSIDAYLLKGDRQRKGCNNEVQPCDALYMHGSGPYDYTRDANNASYLKTLYLDESQTSSATASSIAYLCMRPPKVERVFFSFFSSREERKEVEMKV